MFVLHRYFNIGAPSRGLYALTRNSMFVSHRYFNIGALSMGALSIHAELNVAQIFQYQNPLTGGFKVTLFGGLFGHSHLLCSQARSMGLFAVQSGTLNRS